MKYKIYWSILVNAYNKKNIGKISQARIAELYGESNVSITRKNTEPFTKKTLKKYEKLHNIYFKDVIPFEDVYEEVIEQPKKH